MTSHPPFGMIDGFAATLPGPLFPLSYSKCSFYVPAMTDSASPFAPSHCESPHEGGIPTQRVLTFITFRMRIG